MESADPARSQIVDAWSHEPNLDFLRSFAVLCVVARHLATVFDMQPRPWFQPQALGIFGVLLFFVHTSLVLMLSLDRELERAHSSRVRIYLAFLVRRFFRIYPLSVVTVLFVYFVAIPFAGPDAQRVGLAAASDPLGLLSNLLLVQDLTGRDSVLGPLWSLPAEVQMYLVLPALYFLARTRGTNVIRFGVWPLAVVLAFATWTWKVPFTAGRYAPCFVAGVVCYGLLRVRRPVPFLFLPLVLVAGLALYMVGYAALDLQVGLGTLITILLAHLLPTFARLRHGWLEDLSHTVAKYSYGIYLFHTPCLWVAFGVWREVGPLASFCAFGLLTALASVTGYEVLEAPMIRVGRALADRIGAAGPVARPRLAPVAR